MIAGGKWLTRVQQFVCIICALLVPAISPAQDLSALARLVAGDSAIRQTADGLSLSLTLSQPVPWRARLLADPPRLVMDFREVDWSGLDALPLSGVDRAALRAGVFRPGWSRLVLELPGPMTVTRAGMQTQGKTLLDLQLSPSSDADFRAAALLPEPPEWALPDPAALPGAALPDDSGPLRVVLDPGHGGLDPGAERDGMAEAHLMLAFARELKETLIREGGFAVTLTRDDDVFVPLETRISIARAAGAQVFLSLHADAIAEGQATGATIYRLADDASDEASRALAERHDRDDLLSGVDLREQDDLVATVLMDMARTETGPRITRLAESLRNAIKSNGLRMHPHPIQQAGFSVLKAPDIPSVLLELGFLSSGSDLKRLNDPAWRATMQQAIVQGLRDWRDQDRRLRAAGNP